MRNLQLISLAMGLPLIDISGTMQALPVGSDHEDEETYLDEPTTLMWIFLLKKRAVEWDGQYHPSYGMRDLLGQDEPFFEADCIFDDIEHAHDRWRDLFLQHGNDLIVVFFDSRVEDAEWETLQTADLTIVGRCFSNDSSLEERRIRSGAYGRPVRVPVVDPEEPVRDGMLGWVYAKPGDFGTRWWNRSAKQ